VANAMQVVVCFVARRQVASNSVSNSGHLLQSLTCHSNAHPSLQLPEHSTQLSDSNFLTRTLYKNTY